MTGSPAGVTCRGKNAYASDADAKRAIAQARRWETRQLTYYRCPVCRHFHLTRDLVQETATC